VIRVGLTGNIGSGKSTVARVWADLGARVVDADLIAREVLEPGTVTSARVVEVFGNKVLDGNGSIDRKKLADRVFKDPEALTALNEIVHPQVIHRIKELMKSELPGGGGVFVVEAALILECGREKDYDCIVVVDAGLEQCVDRVVSERGLERQQVERIARSQMSRESKMARADIVINNDGSLDALEAEAARIFGELKKKAEEAS